MWNVKWAEIVKHPMYKKKWGWKGKRSTSLVGKNVIVKSLYKKKQVLVSEKYCAKKNIKRKKKEKFKGKAKGDSWKEKVRWKKDLYHEI